MNRLEAFRDRIAPYLFSWPGAVVGMLAGMALGAVIMRCCG
jgi:uncharacterized membrane-anchored protein YhcB (DUF1043 family)